MFFINYAYANVHLDAFRIYAEMEIDQEER